MSVTVTWSPSPDTNVIGYNVYYGGASRSYTNKTDVGSATNVTINGLVNGVTYYFAATAYNILGIESDYSAEVSYTVPSLATSNRPPTLNAIGNIVISEDAPQQSVTLAGISSGASNEVQTLAVSASSGNTALIPNPTVSYSSPNTSGTLTFTPVANAYGSATITVSVNDGAGGITNRTFYVTVNPVNDPPTLSTPGNLTLNEDAGLQTVSLAGISAGPNESQTLNVTASSSNTGLVPNPTVSYSSPGSTGTLTFTPVANASGSATITVVVNDGGASNNTVTRTFVVTVNPVNDLPTLNPIGNLTLAPGAGLQTVSLSGIGSGANESQALSVTASSSNPGLIPNPTVAYSPPNSTGTVTFTPVANASGSALISVTVNDGAPSNNIVIRSFTVSVGGAPTISAIPNQTISVNSNTAPINFIVSDPDTAAANLSVSASSSSSTLVPTSRIVFAGTGTNRTVVLTPIQGQTGTANITVSVSDGTTSASATFLLTVLGVPAAPQNIMIITNGIGYVSGAKPASMVAGKVYTLTAVPAAGHEFAGWSGGVNSDSPKISFVMRSNMVMQANFVPSPYTRGFYNGLFYQDDDIRLATSGAFTLMVGPHGVYSGTLQLGTMKRKFSGKLNLQCRGTNFIGRPLGTPLVLSIQLGTNDTSGQVFGSLTDGSWAAHLHGDLSPFSKTNAAPFVANYTMVLPSDSQGAGAPAGFGYGTVKVSTLGKALLAGTLADGTKITQSAALSKDGSWPVYISLYKGGGAIVSWMNFTNRTSDDLNGTMRWLKSPSALTKYYPAGFDAEAEAIGSKFSAVAGTNILNAPVAEIGFKDGNLPAEFTNALRVAVNNKISNAGSNALQMTFTSASGTFQGKVTDPSTGRTFAFGGAVLQKAKTGFGSLFGTDKASRVELAY
ncbi:MAG TPA: tandem-95 repeat protein [Candidatus Paceibacterota bacterium]|nr:tandem-95 repeat protein [Candidatus Paceibacterota bacterium]